MLSLSPLPFLQLPQVQPGFIFLVLFFSIDYSKIDLLEKFIPSPVIGAAYSRGDDWSWEGREEASKWMLKKKYLLACRPELERQTPWILGTVLYTEAAWCEVSALPPLAVTTSVSGWNYALVLDGAKALCPSFGCCRCTPPPIAQ